MNESRYYKAYLKDPAKARRALYQAFLDSGRLVRKTAALMGCSRNTVRQVIRRANAERPAWANRPSGAPAHKPMQASLPQKSVIGLWPIHLVQGPLAARLKRRQTAFLLIKK